METVFKVGDVVYDNTITESKGEIRRIVTNSLYPITVCFGNGMMNSYTLDGRPTECHTKTLSFTPYKLDICQERPIELPEVGEEIMVSNDLLNWVLGKFIEYNKEDNYPINTNVSCYKHFKRLR